MINRITQCIVWMFVFSLLTVAASAQGFNPGFEEKNPYPLRAFFNKFSINVSSGYGRTFYRHTLENYSYLRNEAGSFIIPANAIAPNDTLAGFGDWFASATPATVITGNGPDSEVNGYKYIAAGDTSSIDMKGGGYNIPVQLTIYYNLFRVRLGGGVGLNFHGANVPQPENFLSRFPEPGRINTRMSYYYFLLGYSVYEYYDNAFGLDIRYGKLNMGKSFDQNTIEASPFINIGITIEKVISEYFRVYLRPAYEIKSYKVNLPGLAPIDHHDNALLLTLGVSLNYPEMPRSPIKNDNIQMRHYVTDPKGNRREFRGQPFWRKQDPKIGELYPELIKTKRKRQVQRSNFFKNIFRSNKKN